MKVRVDYSDGHYTLELYTWDHEEAGLAYVEIADGNWRDYQLHLKECLVWHAYCRDIDNELYEKENPDATEQQL